MRTSSARRRRVSELGFVRGRWFKKYLTAWRPSLLGITVPKIENTENFKCIVAVFDSDLTKGVMKRLEGLGS